MAEQLTEQQHPRDISSIVSDYNKLNNIAKEKGKKFSDLQKALCRSIAFLSSLKTSGSKTWFKDITTREEEICRPLRLIFEGNEPSLFETALMTLEAHIRSNQLTQKAIEGLLSLINETVSLETTKEEIQIKVLHFASTLINSQIITDKSYKICFNICLTSRCCANRHNLNCAATSVMKLIIESLVEYGKKEVSKGNTESPTLEIIKQFINDFFLVVVGGTDLVMVNTKKLTQTIAYEMIEYFMTFGVPLFSLEGFNDLLATKIVDTLITKISEKTFLQDYFSTLPLMRVVQVILTNYSVQHPKACKVIFTTMLSHAHSPEKPWARAMILNILARLFEDEEIMFGFFAEFGTLTEDCFPLAAMGCLEELLQSIARDDRIKSVLISDAEILRLLDTTQDDGSKVPRVSFNCECRTALNALVLLLTTLGRLSRSERQTENVPKFIGLCWHALFIGLSTFLTFNKEEVVLQLTFKSYENAVLVYGSLGLYEPKISFLNDLCKHATPKKGSTRLDFKTMFAVRTLLNVVHCIGKYLKEGWSCVLQAIYHISRWFETAMNITPFSPDLPAIMKRKEGENTTSSDLIVIAYALNEFPMATTELDDEPFLDLETRLLSLSETTLSELKGEESQALVEQKLFFFELLLNIAEKNDFRIDRYWQNTSDHIKRVLTHPHYHARSRGIALYNSFIFSILSEADKDRLHHVLAFQDKIIEIYTHVNGSQYGDIKLAAIEGVKKMISTSGQVLSTAWKQLFTLLQHVPAENEYILAAFDCVRLIVDDFLLNLPKEYLEQFIATVGFFITQDVNDNISLAANDILWSVGNCVSSETKKEGEARVFTDEELDKNWLVIFHELERCARDKRFDVRNNSIQSLFKMIITHSTTIHTSVIQEAIECVVFRMLKYVLTTTLENQKEKRVPDATGKSSENSKNAATNDNANRDKNGARIVLHHTRDTREKQWDSSLILCIEGVTRLYTSMFQLIFTFPTFVELWTKMTDFISSSAERHSEETTESAVHNTVLLLGFLSKEHGNKLNDRPLSVALNQLISTAEILLNTAVDCASSSRSLSTVLSEYAAWVEQFATKVSNKTKHSLQMIAARLLLHRTSADDHPFQKVGVPMLTNTAFGVLFAVLAERDAEPWSYEENDITFAELRLKHWLSAVEVINIACNVALAQLTDEDEKVRRTKQRFGISLGLLFIEKFKEVDTVMFDNIDFLREMLKSFTSCASLKQNETAGQLYNNSTLTFFTLLEPLVSHCKGKEYFEEVCTKIISMVSTILDNSEKQIETTEHFVWDKSVIVFATNLINSTVIKDFLEEVIRLMKTSNKEWLVERGYALLWELCNPEDKRDEIYKRIATPLVVNFLKDTISNYAGEQIPSIEKVLEQAQTLKVCKQFLETSREGPDNDEHNCYLPELLGSFYACLRANQKVLSPEAFALIVDMIEKTTALFL